MKSRFWVLGRSFRMTCDTVRTLVIDKPRDETAHHAYLLAGAVSYRKTLRSNIPDLNIECVFLKKLLNHSELQFLCL